MKTTHSNLPPIPVDYIVDHALTLTSDSKRRPYVDLINMWAEHEGMGGDVDDVISSITGKPYQTERTREKPEPSQQQSQVLQSSSFQSHSASRHQFQASCWSRT